MERTPPSLLFVPVDVLTALLLFDLGARIGGLIMLGVAAWVVLEQLSPTLVDRRVDHGRAVLLVLCVLMVVALADFAVAM